jgi:hypothetical protein
MQAVDKMASMTEIGNAPPARPNYAELILAIGCGLAITSTALFLGVIPLIRHLAGSRDFVVYWATGQQLLHHANPYDALIMGNAEHAAGFVGKGSYYMRNPPWSLPLALPLGFVSARVAALPWSLLMLGLLVISVRLLWKMFGGAEAHAGRPLDWIGYCFPPALQCVVMGQTSLFLLFGLVLFLRLHRTRPFWAGAALWFCTLKPHLFLPWGVALLMWIVVSRRYRVLAGAAAAMAASCLLTEWIDPAAWAQYMHWAHTSGISNEFIPCFSVLLRNIIDPAAKWIAFVPSVLGCLWAFGYFWRHRHQWNWMEQGNLLMLVSILVAPYCWFYDQCLAMPALFYVACRTASRKVLAGLGILYILIVIQPYAMGIGLESKMYLWPALAWLAWYLWARNSARNAPQAQIAAAATATAN